MNYKKIGKSFCDEINYILSKENIQASFVTGGGYAYDSIKYDDNHIGDFDFMIIYKNINDISKIIKMLDNTNFEYDSRYLYLDKELLNNGKIDIIRLSGTYKNIKSTINLVPSNLIEKICDLENEMIIKKISHNRNTSLFFAYGSDNSRIIVNFISPSFLTKDNNDHYIHLDFSNIIKNDNIYFGILSDAVLKGFQSNYDSIDFHQMRKNFISKIHDFFKINKIPSDNYINLFANHEYFPDYLKNELIEEFNEFGIIDAKKDIPNIKKEPIIFSADFKTNYNQKPFNFINNKDYYMSFWDYIIKMQNNEYDRQYLLDAIGKFFGYLISSKEGLKEYDKDSILHNIDVYGVNDLYLKNVENYKIKSIIEAFIKDLKNNRNNLNEILLNEYLTICTKFLDYISNKKLDNNSKSLSKTKMDINVISNLNSFNEVGTYHNYISNVMPKYTEEEIKMLSRIFIDKNAHILDIMCGYGRLANNLKEYGYNNIVGIDNEEYSFLNIPKDFIFIKNDFLSYEFKNKFKYAYSLYNCYFDKNDLYSNIEKTYKLLDKKGIFIFDCFNKLWRDSIDKYFLKVLYEKDNYKLIIRRDYNHISGMEKTLYELLYKDSLIKQFEFNQCFFEHKDILEVIDNDVWDYSLDNSKELCTRNNEQKHVILLRKK